MKKVLTIQDAFTFLLQGLYFAETRKMEDLGSFSRCVTSDVLKNEMKRYDENAQNKALKLERIFNYLMTESRSRRSEVVEKLMAETREMLDAANSGHLCDMLMIGCLQNINAYMTSSYRTAYLLAVELELDTAADLLQQILKWEQDTGRALTSLANEEFCRLTGESVK